MSARARPLPLLYKEAASLESLQREHPGARVATGGALAATGPWNLCSKQLNLELLKWRAKPYTGLPWPAASSWFCTMRSRMRVDILISHLTGKQHLKKVRQLAPAHAQALAEFIPSSTYSTAKDAALATCPKAGIFHMRHVGTENCLLRELPPALTINLRSRGSSGHR